MGSGALTGSVRIVVEVVPGSFGQVHLQCCKCSGNVLMLNRTGTGGQKEVHHYLLRYPVYNESSIILLRLKAGPLGGLCSVCTFNTSIHAVATLGFIHSFVKTLFACFFLVQY